MRRRHQVEAEKRRDGGSGEAMAEVAAKERRNISQSRETIESQSFQVIGQQSKEMKEEGRGGRRSLETPSPPRLPLHTRNLRRRKVQRESSSQLEGESF
ncbi:hypothetical protein LOK49_LG07G02143 [Camellia lanceoleosa]|uniref:Uncharacterized protein n=1 Tax=Camellia lanceoleosa TaxID=1840588 RepID=A0ACC0GYC1_9ERIC|nr:hypothetical protein LOK49_LG07G02143 [Camellia lanceoleosa]